MASITIPTVQAAELTIGLIRNERALDLLGNGGEVIIAPPYARWMVRFPLAAQERADAQAWLGALVQLNKLSNVFQLTPPSYTGPVGGYAGADPLVAGASQVGTSLDCDGVTPSTLIVSAGDYMEVNDEFKMVIADATSDGAGLVTINFEPALRASPSNNATVEIQTPELNLRLREPLAVWNITPSLWYLIELDCIESF